MNEVRRTVPQAPDSTVNASHDTVTAELSDLEDHILDLGSAISALRHLPFLDCAAGAYLISRVEAHAEGIRRAYYRLPPLAAD